jgi:hypothetical protein
MIFNDPGRIRALTPLNPFDRLDDGPGRRTTRWNA